MPGRSGGAARSRSSPTLVAGGMAAGPSGAADEAAPGKCGDPPSRASTASTFAPSWTSPSSTGSGWRARRPGPRGAPPRTHGAIAEIAADKSQAREARRVAELRLEVDRMGFEDSALLAERVSSVADPIARERLRLTFRNRMAELLSELGLRQLVFARGALLLARSMGSAGGWGFGASWPPVAGASPAVGLDPARALEDRLAHLAFGGIHDIDTLVDCYTTSSDLVARGLLRPKVHKAVLSCLLRWVESEPLLGFQRRAARLAELGLAEPLVLRGIEQRLLQRARRPFAAGQLAGFGRLILDLHERGLEVLDGPSAPILDAPSVERYPPLQVAVLDALRRTMHELPMSRLAADYRGPLLELINMRQGIKINFQVVASDRIVEELHVIEKKVFKRDEPTRVQEELLHWGQFTQALSSAKLVDICEPILDGLLGPPRQVGSLAFLAASCTPGAKEMPPEYLGRKEALGERVRDVWEMVARIFFLLGDAEEASMAEVLLRELAG